MPGKVRGIMSIVDRGYELDAKLKKLNKEMDYIKSMIRRHAKVTMNPYIKGNVGKVTVSDHTVSSVSPASAYIAVNETIETFFSIVKVNLSDLRGAIGKIEAERLISGKTTKFHVVKFHSAGDYVEVPGDRKSRKMDI